MEYYATINGEQVRVFPKEVPVEETGVSYTVFTDENGKVLTQVKNATQVNPAGLAK